ncbi:unnamed protein product [Lactuca saligna]|uniref:Uncharacterized protein n=1 Tax=Lactuca saligna TaxID=75948 RepID=A0AA35YP70_LACSI|nr:unnamed protein product [Lactuca saligna]
MTQFITWLPRLHPKLRYQSQKRCLHDHLKITNGHPTTISTWLKMSQMESQNEDLAINLLQTQLEVSLVREEIANDLRELRRSLTRDMDALNHEVDDVRAGQLDLSNMVADLKNHFSSLQASYVNIVMGKKKSKKVK